MTAVPGDPAGCSQLGAELRTLAARLQDREPTLPDGRERHLVRVLALRLDRAGEACQRFAQDLAAAQQELRRLALDVEAAGLVLDGLAVAEPWGVASAETAQRRRASLPVLQRRSERLGSSAARARGALRRSLDEATAALRAAGAASGPAARRHDQ
ncbi:hypothetical protein [Lapillicoccus jejuensis]|uniref:Uncharacterized protein n=1 Tax=Lapillicoccus jejuensis TaxID=402171 RepID=A0A542E2W7_9MICO|nr:hypothetical protein [Lapillicoccus jejuensis]TQJ09584.1 hypothetical protein FB458_2696 [Lapillicoccus jejuensis]